MRAAIQSIMHDMTALDETLHAVGIELCFAEMKHPVKDKLTLFDVFAPKAATI